MPRSVTRKPKASVIEPVIANGAERAMLTA